MDFVCIRMIEFVGIIHFEDLYMVYSLQLALGFELVRLLRKQLSKSVSTLL